LPSNKREDFIMDIENDANKSVGYPSLRGAFIFTFLLTVSASAVAGNIVPVTTLANDDLRPRIAFNPLTSEYLVVWQHQYNLSDQDIFLRRLAPDGQPLLDDRGIVSTGASESNPAVVYNLAENRYLIAYEYEYNESDHDIYAVQVSSDGTVFGAPIGVSTSSTYESEPALAYSAALNRYLIVWQSLQGSDEFKQNDIYGRWLNADGSYASGVFLITGRPIAESAPTIAAANDGTCLVVWHARRDALVDYGIYGRRVATDGSLLGGELAISTWEYDQVKPRIVFNPTAGEYLVVWEDHHWGWGNDWDIYGRRISAVGVGVGDTFGIAWESPSHYLNPDVAWLPLTNEYLVAWQFEYSQSDYDIYSRRLNADGTTTGDIGVVSNSGIPELAPSTATADDGSYIIAWEDARNSGTNGMDIYAFTWDAFVPIFSGHVYTGPVRDTGSPLAGVTVSLYGSNNEPDFGTYITQVQTGADGYFFLPAQGDWEYYNLVVQCPQGYSLQGAESLDGFVVTSDWIRYALPLRRKNLAANVFYFVPQKPAITYGPVVEQVTQASATIIWQTNLPADGTVEYGATALMGAVASSAALETTHSIVLTDLSSATTYTFVVASTDSAGQITHSGTLYFQTNPLPDRTPPTVRLPNISVIQSGMVIAPEVADNIGVQMVQFFIDEVLLFTDFSPPYEFSPDTAILAAGDHVLKTRVYDIAGNTVERTAKGTSFRLYDPTAPSVHITSLQKDEVVSGKIGIFATLNDDTGLRMALLSVDSWMKGQHDFSAPPQQTEYVGFTWDSSEVPNGRHRIAVHAYDVDWKSGLATVDVIVNNEPPPPPPKLIVTDHVAVRWGNYLHVGITIENIGQSTARNIVIRDNLLLFQPVAKGTVEANYACELGPSHKGSDCVIRPTMSILAGNSRMFTYDAVPVLVHPDTITPMIGNTVELTWDSLTQGGFSADFQPAVFQTTNGELMKDAHANAVKSSDYLIVTSPDNLMAFNPAADVNALLGAMAELAKLKNGTLGFLYGPMAFFRAYQTHDGFAVGDVLGDDRDEVIVASVAGGDICTYVPDSHDWFWLPQDRCFKPGLPEGFEAGDRIAVGLLPGGTKEKIVMADASSDLVIVYNSNGTIDSKFSVDIEPWDALAVGDVFKQQVRAEIIVGDCSAGKIVTYTNTGTKVQEFTKEIEAHDCLAAGDVLGDSVDEIVFGDISDNKIYIFSIYGQQLGALTCQFDEGDKVAVADVYDVWPNDKKEIIVTTHAADMIRVFKGDGSLMKVFKRPLDAFDGLAVGRILTDNVPYILLADQSQHAIDAHSFAHETENRQILADLIKTDSSFSLFAGAQITPTGQWSSKLKDGWVSDGYLLIVGETEIVPAWGDRCIGTVLTKRGDELLQPDVTDYPYANTYGEETKPELIIGRIIGNTAKDLIIPIQTSIYAASGAGGYHFDRSDALTAGGFPACLGGGCDTIDFKSEVAAITKTLTNKGVASKTLYTPDCAIYNPPGIIDQKATIAAIQSNFFADLTEKDIVFLAGHGSANSWDEIGVGDILARTNPFGTTSPFVFPSSCSTGSYHGTTSFAEALLQRRAGVVLAATRWGLSSHAWISNYLFQTWDPGESVGKAVRDVKQNIGDITMGGIFGFPSWTFPDNSARYWSAIYHVFGDPKFGSEPLISPPQDSKSGADLKALSTFDVFVPHYEIEHINGLDQVRIPGGIVLTVPQMPAVPAYRVTYKYPRNARIQDVILLSRSEPAAVEGLMLPITEIAVGGLDILAGPAPSGEGGDNMWWPEKDFDWSLMHGPDATTLAVTVYPFIYDAGTGEAIFHNQYSFAVDYVDSEVNIASLSTDRSVYDPGDGLTIDTIIATPTSEPQTLILSIVVTAEAGETVVSALPCRTLRDMVGTAATADLFDTSALTPGYYRIDVLLASPDGRRLDTRSTTFRIGSPRIEVIALVANPAYIMPRQGLTLSMTVRNTGSLGVEGRAILLVTGRDGEILASFKHPFGELAFGQTFIISERWDPSTASGTSYIVRAYILYDGGSSPPVEIEIGRCIGGLLLGDVNRDCRVDMEDLARVSARWARTPCDDSTHCDDADIDQNNTVDLLDLYSLAEHWLESRR
jgi:hypothetical protein